MVATQRRRLSRVGQRREDLRRVVRFCVRRGGRVRRTALAHALDVCETENPTRDTIHCGACLTAPWPLCRKRPFTTHADRLRPRLEGRRLPVAGPAARRAADRGRRRRPPRDSAAAYACSGRATCSSSGSSPASGRNLAHLVNTMQDLRHDQPLLPLDFVRGGLFMETELGYDTRVVVGWGGACSARPFTFLRVRLA